MNNTTQPPTPTPTPQSELAQIGDELRTAFGRNRRVMSFGEFYALFRQQPTRHARSVAQYVKDCFDHYGTSQVQTPAGPRTRYRVFDGSFSAADPSGAGDSQSGKERLFGQEEVQGRVYRAICNFVRDGRISRLLLLHGPNGSAKSTLVACLLRALEHYSTQEDGALYRFNWIFPAQRLTRGGIGFGQAGRGEGEPAPPGVTDSFAYLEDDQIDVKIGDETSDHPLLLLPIAKRQRLLTECLGRRTDAKAPASEASGDGFVLADYLWSGDLSPRNKQIFEALLVSYKGDYLKVLRHVQVERFYISRRYRQGAVTVEPQMAVDATARQITADRSLQALPPALQALSMFSFGGELVDANRGVLEYADLLKRPLEAYKYLLGTVEHGRVPVDTQILYLDELFVASANELHLSAFKELADFPSFKGRMELIRVPYLLDYTQEQRIYEDQIRPAAVGRHIAPHATRAAALWGVLTRMRKPQGERYEKPLQELVNKLGPLDKAYLYAHRRAAVGLSPEQTKELLAGIEALYSESESYPIYEGRTGASPRELKSVLLNAAQSPRYRCLSPFAVLEEIEELCKAVTVHEFLKQEVQPGGYHDSRRFIQVVRDELLGWIDEEVRTAMGLVDESQYAGVFARYVNHVSHWIKKEKVVNPITGGLEEPDEKMMTEIERLIGVTAKREEHRKDLLHRIAAWYLSRESQRTTTPVSPAERLAGLDYGQIFPQQFQTLRESYFAERKKILKKTNQDLLQHLSESEPEPGATPATGTDALTPDALQRVQTTLGALRERFGYCRHCARDAVSYLLRRRYT